MQYLLRNHLQPLLPTRYQYRKADPNCRQRIQQRSQPGPLAPLDWHCFCRCQQARLCSLRRHTFCRRRCKGHPGRCLRSRNMQRPLPAVSLCHQPVPDIHQHVDGKQGHGKHCPVQRHAQCSRPERHQHLRAHSVPEILLITRSISICSLVPSL